MDRHVTIERWLKLMLHLITAAGAGQRFKKEGISRPKPLIKVNNLTLLEHTLDSFKFEKGDELLIAVQRSHRVRKEINATLEDKYKNIPIHWFEIDQLMPGQLATSYAAIKYFCEKRPGSESTSLLIHNCDTGFNWSPKIRAVDYFASMPVFKAKGTHWSFGKPDPNNSSIAIAIAEKKRISDLASIGLYGFANCNLFLKAALTQLTTKQTINNEYYIAPLLQNAIESGEIVSLPRVKGVKVYGTPAELVNSFEISLEELIFKNKINA